MALHVPDITLHNDSIASLLKNTNYDGTITIFVDHAHLHAFSASIATLAQRDEAFGTEVQLIACDDVPGGRLVLTPTGSLNSDVDDVRKFSEAAVKAAKRALAAGMKRPLLHFADIPPQKQSTWTFTSHSDYERYLEVSLLGILGASFDPIDVREHHIRQNIPYKSFINIGIALPDTVSVSSDFITKVRAIETGKRIVRDTGSPDPERMSPHRFASYLTDIAFKNVPNITIHVLDDLQTIEDRYPLLGSVIRASKPVKRHHPRVVRIEYKSPSQSNVKENLYLVGKGVTYDTGGADIKAGGIMRSMSRDKCGAATVAGFMRTVAELAPKTLNVTAALALVRNSVGSDSYVSDEVIYSRAGVRVLVGNTDAEGRMVMCDLLAQFKEEVLSHSIANARLFTVATLTGHAIRAYGNYSIAIDNGPARFAKISHRLFDAGHIWGDPFEISTLRREDFNMVAPGSNSEDVVQANDKPSTATERGHQYPMAFISIASGLQAESAKEISYTHLDIAGSAEEMSGVGLSLPAVKGSLVAALTGAFLTE